MARGPPRSRAPHAPSAYITPAPSAPRPRRRTCYPAAHLLFGRDATRLAAPSCPRRVSAPARCPRAPMSYSPLFERATWLAVLIHVSIRPQTLQLGLLALVLRFRAPLSLPSLPPARPRTTSSSSSYPPSLLSRHLSLRHSLRPPAAFISTRPSPPSTHSCPCPRPRYLCAQPPLVSINSLHFTSTSMASTPSSHLFWATASPHHYVHAHPPDLSHISRLHYAFLVLQIFRLHPPCLYNYPYLP